MGKSGIVVTGLIGIALVIGIIIVANNKEERTSDDQTTTTQTQKSDTAANTQTPQSANLITYTNNGFSPSSLTVKSGDSVTIKNDSNTAVQVQSDPHPVHTDNDELNVGVIAAGKSATFKLTKTGTWGYHNHLNTSETGTIKVQ